MTRRKKKTSATRRLHRTLGASAAIFALFMSLSGLALNHTHGLGFDKAHVSQTFLLDWYGIGPPSDILSFNVGGRWLSLTDTRIYIDGRPASSLKRGVGVVFSEDMMIAAGQDELALLDGNGMLIEKMAWDKPDPIESIGLFDDGAVSLRVNGKRWQGDSQLLEWKPADPNRANPSWSVPEPAPDEILEAVASQVRGADLSLEKLLLDLHSGRFFGMAGLLFYDLLALSIGFLAVSGLVIWTRSRKNGKTRRQKSGK